MNRTCLINKQDGTCQTGGLELLEKWQPNCHYLWLDLWDDDEHLHRDLLENRFGIDRLAVDDAMRSRHPPKYEALDDGVQFMLVRGLDEKTTDIRFSNIQIAFFFNQQFIIIRHTQTSPSTNRIWDAMERGEYSENLQPEWFAYRVMRAVSDRYLPIVMSLEARLEDIELELLNKPSDSLLGELMEYSRHLKRLRRIGTYHENSYKRLLNPNYGNPLEQAEHGFIDLFEQSERLASLSNLQHEITSDLINGYVSVSAHRLNNVMRVLTVITAIFVPLSFLAGIYGMNFELIPELKFKYGYFVLIGAMAIIATTLILMFRRKGWL